MLEVEDLVKFPAILSKSHIVLFNLTCDESHYTAVYI